MPTSRRKFLSETVLGVAGVVAAAAAGEAQVPTPASQTPGAPPVIGTGPATGPEVSVATFAEAEKLVQVTMSPAERAEAAGNWRGSMATLFERRLGPRKISLGEADVPATAWEPELGRIVANPDSAVVYLRSPGQFIGKPFHSDEDLAFASVTELSEWMEAGLITSERLTRLYISRLKKYGPTLKCVITLCEEHAMEQARKADKEIAANKRRGPLHGIPWGAKDLLDTAGIATTWGVEFHRDRVPAKDATVVQRLNDAGAVLVAKLSLGSLALNDVWFGGQTKNPWLPEEGSSGSSAGPGSAVAAGLVGFAIGSETQGSIISPSMRCGVTGLRPTYGYVPTEGAMTLSWTCDKLGPMARSVDDTMLVLSTIAGNEHHKAPGLMDLGFPKGPVAGLRVGYIQKWMEEATDVDRHALETIKKLGMTAVPVTIPDWPYDSLNTILFAESAAAFEAYTLDGRMNQLTMQTPDAWPNTFRQSRFLSAIDLVQADRFRRKVALEMAKLFEDIDVLLTPSLRDEPMVIFNFTGHPSLTLRAGFVEVSEVRSDWMPDPAHPLPKLDKPRRVPHGVTLVGRLFDEGTLGRVGMALETEFGVSTERPRGF